MRAYEDFINAPLNPQVTLEMLMDAAKKAREDHAHAHEEPVQYPMPSHSYDAMEAAGYDMSNWVRVSPLPGAPRFITVAYENRAMRRAHKKHSSGR